jgi:hypothetical protein
VRLFHIAHHDGLQPTQHVVVCSLPPQGRLRRATPSSPAQHHVQKLYLQTELPSTFVAHVGSQILCHSPTSPTSGVAGCLSRCPRQFVSNGCPFCSTAFFVGTARSRGPAQRRWARAAIRHCDTDLDRPSEATRRLKWKADRTRCRVSDRGSKVRFGALIPKRMCRKGAVSQYCDCFF